MGLQRINHEGDVLGDDSLHLHIHCIVGQVSGLWFARTSCMVGIAVVSLERLCREAVRLEYQHLCGITV